MMLRCAYLIFIILAFALSGCMLSTFSPTPSPEETPLVVRMASPTPESTPLPEHWFDANPVMSGICFEAAQDAAGQLFILRNAEDHIRFYDLADNSGLCRRPVKRNPFDFTTGTVLAGLWTTGNGCIANHEILDVQRDDVNQTFSMSLRFFTEGDCPYELVRPFWIGIPNAQDYEIVITVE